MNRFKERRMELGLSQAELAKQFGVDVGMVSRFENGRCLPNAETLKRMETVLQARDDELLPPDELAFIYREAPVDEDVEFLMQRLKYGKENAMTRPELCRAMQLPDRAVRKVIADARRAGNLIINTGDGSGYYLSDDPDEWARQYHQDTARALSILARRKTMRARLKAAGREV